MWPHTTLQLWMWPVPLGPVQTPWSQQSTGSRKGCPPIGMLAAGLHWNRLPFSFSLEFMQHWVHATHIHSHTCMLEHWQKLLWNCLGLCCFCVFSWQLKHLAYIKLPWRNGQLNLICCIGHRVFHYPKILSLFDQFMLRTCLFKFLYLLIQRGSWVFLFIWTLIWMQYKFGSTILLKCTCSYTGQVCYWQ